MSGPCAQKVVLVADPAVAPAIALSTDTQVTLPDNTNTTLLAANTDRASVVIVNNSGTLVYLSLSGTASINKFELPDGQSFAMNRDAMGSIYTGVISAIQDSGSPVDVSVLETEYV